MGNAIFIMGTIIDPKCSIASNNLFALSVEWGRLFQKFHL